MSSKVRFSSICLLFAALFLGGCKEKTHPEEAEEWPVGKNVYVAGFEDIQTNSVARLWKNGKMENLSGSTNNVLRSSADVINSVARSVFVSGYDVYVAGYDIISNDGEITGQARLWKNGEIQPLESGTYFDQALSVFVSGNDVYVLGCESLKPRPSTEGWIYKYWKNGKATIFSEGNQGGVVIGEVFVSRGVSSIFVSNDIVYVVGGYQGQAKLWKNGVEENLVGGTFAHSVFVSSNDVYIVGNGASGAKLWKNGVEENLVDGSDAYSVYVSGNDVYVAGRIGFERARLWKNGIVQPIIDDKDAKMFYSVFASNEDVYTSGYVEVIEPAGDSNLSIGYYKATLWKNGKILNLNTSGKNNSRALSIYVK